MWFRQRRISEFSFQNMLKAQRKHKRLRTKQAQPIKNRTVRQFKMLNAGIQDRRWSLVPFSIPHSK
jgi:hypothetical protein